MGPPSESHGSRGQRYFFDREVPADLDAALSDALSMLPSFSTSGADGRRHTVMNDPRAGAELSAAVSRFVATLKADGEPPQNMIIAIKTVLHQHASRTTPDTNKLDELHRLVILTAVEAYFDQVTA